MYCHILVNKYCPMKLKLYDMIVKYEIVLKFKIY